MSLKTGEIEVWVKSARFTRDVNTFFEMNPKYVINHKDVRYESDEAKNGGKSP